MVITYKKTDKISILGRKKKKIKKKNIDETNFVR